MKVGRATLLGLAMLALASAAWAGPAPAGAKMDANQYLNDSLAADPTTLDISRRSDAYSSTIMVNTMEGLVRLEEREGKYVMEPAEAESWDVSKDGLTWTFHLRDCKWEDGVPVTAGQYVYSLRRTADPKTGSPSSFFMEPILNFKEVNEGKMPLDKLGVSAPDDHTLVIELAQPSPTFLQMINATVYYPERADKIDQWGDKYGTDAQHYISNGPFKVESWVHNNSIVMVKNDAYWDAQHVYLHKVNIAIMPDETTTYNAFLSGQLDAVLAGQQEWVDKFKASGATYNRVVSNTVGFSFYNCRDKLFKNADVRKAFTLALNREEMIQVCFGGLRIPAEGWVLNNETVDGQNYRQLAGNMIARMKADLKARGKTPRDLLIEGMKQLGLGSDPATLKVTFSLAGTSALYRTMGEYLQQVYAAELGVNLKISYSDWGIFSDNVQKGNYQMGFMGWGAYYNDPYDLLSLFVSSYDAIGTGWKNPQFDKLMADASTQLDEKARVKDLVAAETLLVETECAVCPVSNSVINAFLKPCVKNFSVLAFSTEGYKYEYTEGR